MDNLECLREETIKRINESTGISDIIYYQRLLRIIEDSMKLE